MPFAFPFFRVRALPRFCDAAEYLSRRFAEYRDDAVFRHLLCGVSEKAATLFAAGDDGALGQSARRLRTGFSDLGMFGASLCSGATGKRLRSIASSAQAASLPSSSIRLAGISMTASWRRLAISCRPPSPSGCLTIKNISLPGSIPGIVYISGLHCARAAQWTLGSRPARGTALVVAVPGPGPLPVPIHVLLLFVLDRAARASPRSAAAEKPERRRGP